MPFLRPCLPQVSLVCWIPGTFSKWTRLLEVPALAHCSSCLGYFFSHCQYFRLKNAVQISSFLDSLLWWMLWCTWSSHTLTVKVLPVTGSEMNPFPGILWAQETALDKLMPLPRDCLYLLSGQCTASTPALLPHLVTALVIAGASAQASLAAVSSLCPVLLPSSPCKWILSRKSLVHKSISESIS